MKTCIPRVLMMSLLVLLITSVNAQTDLVPDQNPNYAISRAKYMQMADSINKWHSTTQQDTYEAIDWIADRQKARDARRDFRQQLRLERARWTNMDYRNNNGYYYYPYYRGNNQYYSPYNNFRGNRFRATPYYGFNFGWF